MSAIGGKADVRELPPRCLLIARSGHPTAQNTASGMVVVAPDKTQIIAPDRRVAGLHNLVALITLTINVNEITLPIKIEPHIINQVIMPHWGALWLLHYHSMTLQLLVPLKR